MSVARRLRITALLAVLVAVGLGEWHSARSLRQWQAPLWVGIYPVAGDDTSAVTEWISGIRPEHYAPIQTWLAEQAAGHGLTGTEPFRLETGRPVEGRPPPAPEDGVLSTMLWSLRARWWSHRRLGEQPGPRPEIAVYVLYHDPARRASLPHSVGLAKGRFAIVHAFAAPHMRGSNHVVIAHELLHVVGATDKYDLRNGLPHYPDGYADPGQRPLYPQRRAELMGGRVPVSRHEALVPDGLDRVIVNTATALEVGWPARVPATP